MTLVNLRYDEASQLSNLSGGQGHVYVDAFTYAGHGAVSSFTMGNGATVSLGYGTNGRLQLSDLTLAKNATVLQTYEYKYGQMESGTLVTSKNNGQLAQVESWIGTEQQYQQQFSYDTLGRLTESIEKYGTDLASTAYHVKYLYDVFGNRHQRHDDNSGNPTTIVQKWVEPGDISTATNRYNTGVTYDVAGNITADARFRNLTYGYDANGRQNYAAQANGSGPVTAVFDGAGQRVANKASGVMTIMVYDAAGKLVAEYGATAPSTANLQYVTADYQGSTRVVTSSSGAVVNRRDYLPFGEEIGATVGSRNTDKGFDQGDMVRQKYAGMETDDATSMAHTLWRKQDNFSGRWTSPDPYGGSMTIVDPQSFNRYTYVNNDPVNLVDPTGLALSDIGVYQTHNPAVVGELENEMVRRISIIMKQSQQPKQQEIPPPPKIPSTIGQPYTPNGPGTPPPKSGPVLVDMDELGPPPAFPGTDGAPAPNSVSLTQAETQTLNGSPGADCLNRVISIGTTPLSFIGVFQPNTLTVRDQYGHPFYSKGLTVTENVEVIDQRNGLTTDRILHAGVGSNGSLCDTQFFGTVDPAQVPIKQLGDYLIQRQTLTVPTAAGPKTLGIYCLTKQYNSISIRNVTSNPASCQAWGP